MGTPLAEDVERMARLASLRRLLDRWEAEGGPVSSEAKADAAAAFDEAGTEAATPPSAM